MDAEVRHEQAEELYELFPLGENQQAGAILIKRKRVLIGRSKSCDIVLKDSTVSAIHAVLEVNENSFKLYDMDSMNGTFINSKQVTAQEFNVGDILRFGRVEYKFKNYVHEELELPPLDMLEIAIPPEIRAEGLKRIEKRVLPQTPRELAIVPRVEYPLAKDPKADYSEYIFEDIDVLYPIFKYKINQTAVEVIILFQDQIYSVDYLPFVDGTYYLVGKDAGRVAVEFPCLSIKDKHPFVVIRKGDVFVEPLPGYKCLSLSDKKNADDLGRSGAVILNESDILRLHKDDLQIFVRGSEAPPKVQRASIVTKDRDLTRYVLLMLFLMGVFLVFMQSFEVNKELEKEKAPERIATILYKQKLIVPEVKPTPQIIPTVVPTPRPQPTVAPTPQPQPTVAQIQPTPVPKPEVKKEIVPVVKKEAPVVKKEPPKKIETVQKKAPEKVLPKQVPVRAERKIIKAKPQGPVDTYKAMDFSSTISSLMSKGGAAEKTSVSEIKDSDIGTAAIDLSKEPSSSLQKVKIADDVGSLTGAATGKLDSTKGVDGLVDKREYSLMGIPTNTVILGSMDPDLIRRILQDHSAQFRYCYQRELESAQQGFEGMIVLDFTIGASGHISKAGIATAENGFTPKVKHCVINVLRGIKFPEPLGGGEVGVRQPLNFRLNN